MRGYLHWLSICVVTYVPLSLGASVGDIPADLVRNRILRECNAQTVSAFAQTCSEWRKQIVGNNNGAKLLWLDFLRRDFKARFPQFDFPKELIVADIEATAQGTNEFYEAFVIVKKENPKTLQDYGVIMGRVFHPPVQQRLERVLAVEHVELQRAAWWNWNARTLGFWGFVGGVAFAVSGGVLIGKSYLGPGIPFVIVGGVLLLAVIGGNIWAERRVGQGAELGNVVADVAHDRAQTPRDEADDIERQLGDAFVKRVAEREL